MNDVVLPILQRAAGYFQHGDFASALKGSEEALRLAPGHPEGQHLKALALGRLGRIDEALPCFDLAAQGHPLRHAILSNKGNALRAAERFKESVPAYEASLKANPAFIDAWLGLGLAHRSLGDLARAEDAFLKALAISPDEPTALNNLGVLFQDQDRCEESADMFSRALRQRPDMVYALINSGAMLRRLGRYDEAIANLTKAIAIAPNDSEAHYQLGNAYRQAGSISGAEGAYRKAALLAPARLDVHRDLARMLWEDGRARDFLEPLETAIASVPSAELFILKSEMACLAGFSDIAEAAAREAMLRAPASPAPHRVIGQIMRRAGNDAEAVRSFHRGLAADPTDFETIHLLAEALLDIGEFEKAVTLLDCDAPPEHLQKHIAFKTNAMRLTGDDAYRRYYDYDRFAKKMFIETPEGFDTLAAFNAALVEAIRPLHATKTQPIDQTLYGGTQSIGRLWDVPHPVIQALKRSLLDAADRYVEALPEDASHPFLARKSRNLKCTGAWSVMLADGGGHVDHIHPNGWISASYYVQVPDEVLNSEKQGFLRLGACNARHRPLPAERWLQPEAGSVIFFPSYIWHGVEPFTSDEPRITAPFDLAPAETHD